MKLKRIFSLLLVICLLVSSLPVIAEEEITVLVDGEKVQFDQAPIIENGRTLVPIRAIFEKLGAQVSYEPARKKVYAELGSRYVAFLVGADTIYTNDGGTKIDTPAKIINDRTLVPARAVSEGFGAKVDWNDDTRTVSILSNRGTNQISYKYQSYNSYAIDNEIVLKGICAYPEISSQHGAVAGLNEKFKTGALEYIKYLCDQPNETATSVYDDFAASGSKGEFYPAEYKRTFDITYNRGNIVSFAFHTLSGTNGDFTNGKIKNGLTYDISTGQAITKAHIFNLSEAEIENLVKSCFNTLISSNPDAFSSNASEYVNINAKNAEFYLDDFGVVFFFPAGTILKEKTEFPSARYDFEGNEVIFAMKDFLTSDDIKTDDFEVEEPKDDETKEPTEEVNEEIIEVPVEEPKDDEIQEPTEEPEIKEPEYSEPENNKTYSVSFADNLYSKMPVDKNYMVSPLSIKMALGLLASGAKGETLEQIKEVMQIANTYDFNKKAKELIENYSLIKELSLNVSNSVWVNTDSVQGIEFDEAYKDIVTNFYDATSGKVTNENAVKTINDWVSGNTKGKIPTIISSPDFSAALVNAVYFNARWENEFNKKATQPNDFVDRLGKIHQIDFMRQVGRFNYYKDDAATVVELPYSRAYDHNGTPKMYDNADISMYVIMPKFDTRIVNIEKYLNKVTLENAYLDFSMPKFKTEYSALLSDVLKLLGMNKAFSSSAEFDLMTNKSLAVSEVLHKTYISVDEEGTEAAAATAILMKATSSLITNEPVEIKIDKPFVYVIKDNMNDEIIFIGEYAFVE